MSHCHCKNKECTLFDIPTIDKYCPKCGWKILSKECRFCNMLLFEDDKFCSNCGRPIHYEHSS